MSDIFNWFLSLSTDCCGACSLFSPDACRDEDIQNMKTKLDPKPYTLALGAFNHINSVLLLPKVKIALPCDILNHQRTTFVKTNTDQWCSSFLVTYGLISFVINSQGNTWQIHTCRYWRIEPVVCNEHTKHHRQEGGWALCSIKAASGWPFLALSTTSNWLAHTKQL